MPRRYVFALTLLLVWFLVTGALYALRTPRWQAPDEPAHFNYVRYVAQHWTPPVLEPGCYDQAYLERLKSRRFPPSMSVDAICYEAHQPPLYYYLAAVPYGLAVALGFDPLLAVRLFTVVLGAGVVLVSAAIGLHLFPERPLVAVSAAGVVATVPMHVAMLASANNDALAELVLGLAVWQMVRLLRRPRTAPRDWYLLGVLLGAGMLTKTTTYIAIPMALAVAWWRWRGIPGGSFLRTAGAPLAVALLFALPWFARNSLTYGGLDVLGLRRHEAVVVGQPRTAQWLQELGALRLAKRFVFTTFHSFWGQFGWMAAPLPSAVYSVLWLVSALGLAGVVLRLWSARRLWPTSTPSAYRLLLLWVGLNLLAYGWYNLTFVQHQGRYLFPSLPALALFLVLGLHEWFVPRYRPLVSVALVGGLAGLAWWSLLVVLPGLAPG